MHETQKQLGHGQLFMFALFHSLFVFNHLETEYTNFCSFAGGIFARSSSSFCSTVCARHYLILTFMMLHAFSIWMVHISTTKQINIDLLRYLWWTADPIVLSVGHVSWKTLQHLLNALATTNVPMQTDTVPGRQSPKLFWSFNFFIQYTKYIIYIIKVKILIRRAF